MTSSVHFVFEQIGERKKITDFRNHNYTNIQTPEPEETYDLPTMGARDFLIDLAGMDPKILECISRRELVDRLEAIAENADTSADGGFGTRTEISLYCAIRDNIYQLLELLQ